MIVAVTVASGRPPTKEKKPQRISMNVPFTAVEYRGAKCFRPVTAPDEFHWYAVSYSERITWTECF